MNPSLRIKVLLLIGNNLLCKSLARIIQQRPDIDVIAGQAANLSDVALAIARSEGGVILLDSVSANALTRQRVRMRDLNPNVQILMVGMAADEGTFLRAVRAGVRGYLLHEASAADLISAIRALARREVVCPSQLCNSLFDVLSGVSEFTPGVRKMALRLTRRQQELLPMVARGLTNKEIASNLNLSEQTVKNHVHRMLRKIGANDRNEVIEIARAEDSLN